MRSAKRWAAAWLSAVLVFGAQAGRAGAELRVLTWEGYADPSFTADFEARTGCRVSTVFVGMNDDFPARLAAGGIDFDVISPSIDTTTIMAKLGLVEPIVPSWVWRFDQIYDVFRTHPGIAFDGEIWAVPFAWSAVSLMYRTDKIARAPDSWEALWDPAYAGKIALYDDKSSLYTAARLLFGRDADVYALDDAQLAAVARKLVAQKPLLRKYWSSAGELISLYVTGDVWVSDSWGAVDGPLARQGIPVARFIPKERANAWADAWQIVRGTPNRDCAYAWLNFTLSPEAQCGLERVTGFSGVNPKALARCPDAGVRARPDAALFAQLDFWREPKRILRYIDTWNAVKAAR